MWPFSEHWALKKVIKFNRSNETVLQSNFDKFFCRKDCNHFSRLLSMFSEIFQKSNINKVLFISKVACWKSATLLKFDSSAFEGFSWNFCNYFSTQRAMLLTTKYVFKILFHWKVFNAQSRGATGVIIYSDPIDYAPEGKKFIEGRWLPDDGVQRGSILKKSYLDVGEGDPLTPGYPAKCECKFNKFNYHRPYISIFTN